METCAAHAGDGAETPLAVGVEMGAGKWKEGQEQSTWW